MLKAVFFDLDGTLLPLNEDGFIKIYFGLLCKRMAPLGYDKEAFANVIWKGTEAMYKNDGSKTNEEVFWDYFAKVFGEEKLKDKSYVDEFYTTDFKETKKCCEENPLARKIIDFCHEVGLRVFLTTNPLFPRIGTLTRMSYIDLKEEDFELVTAYENSRFCKPNPKYFLEILKEYNLNPNEVILFGNNTYEDGECSLVCGIKCYMVGNYLIDHPRATHKFEHISLEEVIDKIKSHMK